MHKPAPHYQPISTIFFFLSQWILSKNKDQTEIGFFSASLWTWNCYLFSGNRFCFAWIWLFNIFIDWKGEMTLFCFHPNIYGRRKKTPRFKWWIYRSTFIIAVHQTLSMCIFCLIQNHVNISTAKSNFIWYINHDWPKINVPPSIFQRIYRVWDIEFFLKKSLFHFISLRWKKIWSFLLKNLYKSELNLCHIHWAIRICNERIFKWLKYDESECATHENQWRNDEWTIPMTNFQSAKKIFIVFLFVFITLFVFVTNLLR